MKRDPLPAHVLATRIIPNVAPDMAKELGLTPDQKSLAIVTADSDDVTYTDFIEIRSAIERLGSEAPVRDWTHDPTYQAFKRLQRAQN